MPAAALALSHGPAEGPVELIHLLEEEAELAGLSGNELARRIGVDQALWSRVRRGVDGERFGPDACARIVRAFPHLRAAAVRYLSRGRMPAPDALKLLEEASRTGRDDPPPDR